MTTPYMPLYIADYQADTAHLDALEHGVYMLLIMNYWQRGKPLPDDDNKLYKIARLTDVEHWLNVRSTMLEFFSVQDGFWTHIRIERELETFKRKSEKAREAGLKSAQVRRDKRNSGNQRKLNGRSANVQRMSNHTDTDTDTDNKERGQPKTDFPQDFVEFWERYPHPENRGSKPKAFKAWGKLPDCTKGEIYSVLPIFTKYHKQPNATFPKMAVTWLNQSCWETPPEIVKEQDDIMAQMKKKYNEEDGTNVQ